MQEVQQNTPEETGTSVVSHRKAILLTTLAALGAGLVASLTSVAVMFILLPGQYSITARSKDGMGQLQTSQKQGTILNGATGYYTIQVQVG